MLLQQNANAINLHIPVWNCTPWVNQDGSIDKDAWGVCYLESWLWNHNTYDYSPYKNQLNCFGLMFDSNYVYYYKQVFNNEQPNTAATCDIFATGIGETKYDDPKFTVYGYTEIKGTVVYHTNCTGAAGTIDNPELGIVPDPNYSNLLKGEQDDSSGNPQKVMVLESYGYDKYPPPSPNTYNHSGFICPDHHIQVLEDGKLREIQNGNHVKVRGLYIIDQDHGKDHRRGLLDSVGGHGEFHPFDWRSVELVKPLQPGDVNVESHLVAAPIFTQSYSDKWWWNQVQTVSGYYVDDSEINPVYAKFFIEAPPQPTGGCSGPCKIIASEDNVVKRGQVNVISALKNKGEVDERVVYDKGKKTIIKTTWPNWGVFVYVSVSGSDPLNPSIYNATWSVKWRGPYELKIENSNGDCQTIGGTWHKAETCLFTTGFNLPVGSNLIIDHGVRLATTDAALKIDGPLTNNGIIDNIGSIVVGDYSTLNNSYDGTINNYGSIAIDGSGSIDNYGNINNEVFQNAGIVIEPNGNLRNYPEATINNSLKSIIDNVGFITNYPGTTTTLNGIINNHGTIINDKFSGYFGSFDNEGTIYDYCLSQFEQLSPITGNQPIQLCGPPSVHPISNGTKPPPHSGPGSSGSGSSTLIQNPTVNPPPHLP